MIITVFLLTFTLIRFHGYKFKSRSHTVQLKSSSWISKLYSLEPNSISADRKTFKRFIEREIWKVPEYASLYPILCSIEVACLDINRLMRRVSTDNLDGLHKSVNSGNKSVNIQGEDQRKLDIVANRIMKVSLCCSGKVSLVASEEDDQPCLCSDVVDNSAFSGDFVAVFDPLDGSSNIDSGLSTGTIFGIYRNPKYGFSDPMSTVKQKGGELLVAGYCLYSASTHIVITIRNGVHIFTIDDVTGEFYLTRSNVKIPTSGSIYSFNDANFESWSPKIQDFLKDFRRNELHHTQLEKKPSARYMGALVADMHNILLNGGIFGYPGTVDKPNGKLRLLYEANPLALIVEEAGGLASNGASRILDMPVKEIHQRTPLFIGSKDLVNSLEFYLQP